MAYHHGLSVCREYVLHAILFGAPSGPNARFVSALNFSGWASSKQLTAQQVAENACASCYLILLVVKDAWDRKGGNWYQCCLPKATVVNMLSLGPACCFQNCFC